MSISGLGIDVCSVERMRGILEGRMGRRFLDRVFTPNEQAHCGRRADAASAFAGRFAAKEALVKALGAPAGLKWKEMEIVRADGAPSFALSGVARDEIQKRGVSLWLSITHDAGVAAAVVVLERA